MYTAFSIFLLYILIIELYIAQMGTLPVILKEFCNSLTLKILILSIIAILGSYPTLIKEQYYLWLGFAYLYTMVICNKTEHFHNHEADLEKTHNKREENNKKIHDNHVSHVKTSNFLSKGTPHFRSMGETGGNIPEAEKLDNNNLDIVHKSPRS